jgi:hypothetical protein
MFLFKLWYIYIDAASAFWGGIANAYTGDDPWSVRDDRGQGYDSSGRPR